VGGKSVTGVDNERLPRRWRVRAQVEVPELIEAKGQKDELSVARGPAQGGAVRDQIKLPAETLRGRGDSWTGHPRGENARRKNLGVVNSRLEQELANPGTAGIVRSSRLTGNRGVLEPTALDAGGEGILEDGQALGRDEPAELAINTRRHGGKEAHNEARGRWKRCERRVVLMRRTVAIMHGRFN